MPATALSFNRWFVPLAAVLIHICIGSIYAWSTFNRPIKAIFPDAPTWFSPPYTTFTTALVLLGLSAAFGGHGLNATGHERRQRRRRVFWERPFHWRTETVLEATGSCISGDGSCQRHWSGARLYFARATDAYELHHLPRLLCGGSVVEPDQLPTVYAFFQDGEIAPHHGYIQRS
jgi:hypothetical protein